MNMARDDRVAVYIDGSNLYHSLRSLANRTDLDFLEFARNCPTVEDSRGFTTTMLQSTKQENRIDTEHSRNFSKLCAGSITWNCVLED